MPGLSRKKIVGDASVKNSLVRTAGAPIARPKNQERLAKVVLRAFSENDFHRVDMRSIAEDAGMSLATIYKVYGDKEHLLFAFINDWLSELGEKVFDALQGLESPKEKLRKCLWCHLDYYERRPEVGRAIFMVVPMQTWMQDESFAQREFTKLLTSVVVAGQEEGVIDRRIPAHTVLDGMFGTVIRAFVMWCYRRQQYSLISQFDDIFKMLWSGISSEVQVVPNT